ncbi:uncharacterized protein [Temnothorax nylanderi]|uniref:uncharacterized protein n=1 Tax=Temnothorax nylanderi TaxID=102681 RepID=UPI003A8A801A
MVMEDLETHCLSLLEFDVRIFHRYVDDVFTIVPKVAINALLEAFNSYHPRLHFTYEIEADNSLPFLDTIVIRDGDKLITDCNPLYVKGLSEGIRGTLERVGFGVVYKIPKKLSAVIRRGKDRLATEKETNVVYKIDCENCDASYIGQTKRHLETRVKEHFNDTKKHDSNFSVVSKHWIQNDHNFKWSDPKILHKERNLKMREIAEMFFIKKHNNTINLKKTPRT